MKLKLTHLLSSSESVELIELEDIRQGGDGGTKSLSATESSLE